MWKHDYRVAGGPLVIWATVSHSGEDEAPSLLRYGSEYTSWTTLKMEAARSSETLVPTHRSIRCHMQ